MKVDLNLLVLWGRLATDPELRVFDSGSRLMRYLVTTKTEHPRHRVDVIPVTLWDPDDELVSAPGIKGQRIWICGAVQRRFWEGPEGRQSRVEVVAEQINLKDLEDLEPMSVK